MGDETKNRLQQLKETISEQGLKVTSQRIAIYDALLRLDHPTAEEIHKTIQERHPSISLGTVYKTLETFVEKELIKKVKTDTDTMRYDTELHPHTHLYCKETNTIKDYFDEELQSMIHDYLEKNDIPNFQVDDVQVQINGKLTGQQ